MKKTTALFLGRFQPDLFSRKKVRIQKSRAFHARALTSSKQKTALFLGRFQPFHLGHLYVVKQLSEKHSKVIILIGTRQEKGKKNPFSFSERKKMISAALRRLGIKNCVLKGIADNRSDEKWFAVLRKAAPKNSVMFSGNAEMLALFKRFRFPIRKVNIYRGISATKVRKLIRRNGNWKKYVDSIVAEFLEKNRLLKKVK